MTKRSIEITPNCEEYGNVTEVFVEGVAMIIFVGNGVVRVSHFGTDGDSNTKAVVLRLLWDAETFHAFAAAVYRASISRDDGVPQPRNLSREVSTN